MLVVFSLAAAYTHRIGRTGRAGKKGIATSFINNDNAELFPGLKKMLIKTKNRVPEQLARADKDADLSGYFFR